MYVYLYVETDHATRCGLVGWLCNGGEVYSSFAEMARHDVKPIPVSRDRVFRILDELAEEGHEIKKWECHKNSPLA